MITTGVKLVNAMKERGLSQHALARATGINQSNVSKYCNGFAEPSDDTLKKMADAMGLTVDDLRGESIRSGKRIGISLRFSQAIIRLLESPDVEVKQIYGGYTFTVKPGKNSALDVYLRKIIRAHRFYTAESFDDDMYQDLCEGLAARYERAAEKEARK